MYFVQKCKSLFSSTKQKSNGSSLFQNALRDFLLQFFNTWMVIINEMIDWEDIHRTDEEGMASSFFTSNLKAGSDSQMWDSNLYISGEYFDQQVSVYVSVNCSQSLFLTPLLIDRLLAKLSFQSVPQLTCVFCKWNSRKDHERESMLEICLWKMWGKKGYRGIFGLKVLKSTACFSFFWHIFSSMQLEKCNSKITNSFVSK